ncbi:MAG TPA: DNA alkylation repair protein [Anaerolineae bacterium]|nr:DNA alkylation repair protein [Anaerolineae bacterium]
MELKEKTRRIVTAYDPHAADDTASALQRLWSQVPATEGGARLVKAEARAELSGLGVPVPALSEIGKEIGKVAHKRVGDFLPLGRRLWEGYGREGRLVASTFLGPMELAAPDQVMPAIEEMARTCATWEDCDQLAMRALEPVVRKKPEDYLAAMETWVDDRNKWVRRAGITVVARLPMKRPEYTETCLRMVEPALGDEDQDVRRAVSFATRMGARGEPGAVVAFIRDQAHRTDAASIWVLCDAMRSMTRKSLPHFKELLPVYENWLTAVGPKSQRSVASAIKALRSA